MLPRRPRRPRPAGRSRRCSPCPRTPPPPSAAPRARGRRPVRRRSASTGSRRSRSDGSTRSAAAPSPSSSTALATALCAWSDAYTVSGAVAWSSPVSRTVPPVARCRAAASACTVAAEPPLTSRPPQPGRPSSSPSQRTACFSTYVAAWLPPATDGFIAAASVSASTATGLRRPVDPAGPARVPVAERPRQHGRRDLVEQLAGRPAALRQRRREPLGGQLRAGTAGTPAGPAASSGARRRGRPPGSRAAAAPRRPTPSPPHPRPRTLEQATGPRRSARMGACGRWRAGARSRSRWSGWRWRPARGTGRRRRRRRPGDPADDGADRPGAAGDDPDWPTYHGSADRAGLAAGMPAVSRLAVVASVPLDAAVYASPIVVNGITVVATERNTLYGLDAYRAPAVEHASRRSRAEGGPALRQHRSVWHHRHARIRPLDRLGIRRRRVPRARAPRACRTGPAHRIRALADERRPAGRVPGRDAGAGRADVEREPGMGAVRRAVRRLRELPRSGGGRAGRETGHRSLTPCRPLGRPASGHLPDPWLIHAGRLLVAVGNGESGVGDPYDYSDSVLRDRPDLGEAARIRFRRRPGRPTTTRTSTLARRARPSSAPNGCFPPASPAPGTCLRAIPFGGSAARSARPDLCRSFGGTAVDGDDRVRSVHRWAARGAIGNDGAIPCCGTRTATSPALR